MDFMVIYNALAMNDGKPQLFFDHTAYLTILSVKSWFRLLHALGLLDAWSLSAIPPATDAAAFDAAMTHAVRAGRVLAFLIATGCVLIFAWPRSPDPARLARRDAGDAGVRVLRRHRGAFADPAQRARRGLSRHLRADDPDRGRTPRQPRASAGLALAAALCVLGLENKVQAILLIGALPLLILPFGGAASASVAFWRNTPIELACGRRRRRRGDIGGMGGLAADCHRLRPRLARRRAVPSAVARPLRPLSGRAAGPDRRLHDRLCRDLARSARPRRWHRCLRLPPAP